MEYLTNGYTLEICPGGFPLSTDSMVLAHFIHLPRSAHVLDLGSGCGTLGLLLCAKRDDCSVTGIELDPEAHACALENIRRNGLEGRMESRCGDLRNATGSYDCCVSNPPYFTGGPASKLQNARREDTCNLEELFAAAGRSLKFGGDLFLVHRPERLAQLCACASANSLEPKRLLLVRHKEGDPICLVALQCRKGAKPGLRFEELALHDRQGEPTEAYRTIYHL